MARFQKGHPKLPGAGIKKGQKHFKATLEERFREHGFDPVDSLIKLLQDKDSKLSDRDRASFEVELLSFIYPKLKGVEHTGKDGGPIEVAAQPSKITELLKDPEAFAALETLDRKLSGPKAD